MECEGRETRRGKQDMGVGQDENAGHFIEYGNFSLNPDLIYYI